MFKWESNNGTNSPIDTATIHVLTLRHLKIVVHRYVGYGGTWFLTCNELNISREPLQSKDITEAKQEAIQKLRERLNLWTSDINSYTDEDKQAKDDSELSKLQDMLVKHGGVIRAIPMKTRGVYEAYNIDKYANGKVEYLPEFGRDMLIVEEVPKDAGKLLLVAGQSTSSTTQFKGALKFNTMEELIDALSKL